MCSVCAGQAHEAQAYAKAHVCTHYSRWSGKWSLLLLLWRILWSRLDERITGQLSFCTNADTRQRCMCCTTRHSKARRGQARHANKAYAGYPFCARLVHLQLQYGRRSCSFPWPTSAGTDLPFAGAPFNRISQVHTVITAG